MHSREFMAAREAHLRAIGREDLLPFTPRPREVEEPPEGLSGMLLVAWLNEHPEYRERLTQEIADEVEAYVQARAA